MYNLVKKIVIWFLTASLKEVQKDNKELINRLEVILPSLKDQANFQNNDSQEDSEYLQYKKRNIQAFQLEFTLEKIQKYKENNNKQSISIIDIGDSSGNHLIQLQKLDTDIKDVASVNLDIKAVEKIQKKGIKAYHSRAEELVDKYDLKPDFFLSFEMLEHLTDPIRFLYNISKNKSCDRFIISVPYQKVSRVGFWHMRFSDTKTIRNAEDVHIFELSPEDWKLLVQFAGWEILSDKIYYQYPKWHYLYFTKYLWKKYDFEGFYIMELQINHKWLDLYESW